VQSVISVDLLACMVGTEVAPQRVDHRSFIESAPSPLVISINPGEDTVRQIGIERDSRGVDAHSPSKDAISSFD